MCLMCAWLDTGFLQKSRRIWKSLPSVPTMFCVEAKPTNRLLLRLKWKIVIWVFSLTGHFSEISARELSNIIPAQEDVDGMIWMVRLGLLVNSKVLWSPDFSKRRYFFINLGCPEIAEARKIGNQKKAKTVPFLRRPFENTTLCANSATKPCEKYEFRQEKLLAALFRHGPSRKKETCLLLEANRFSNVFLKKLCFDVFLASGAIVAWPAALDSILKSKT